MPTLKIHYHHTDDCTPQKIFVNGKKDQFYFVFFSFLDITTSTIRRFLDKN